MQKVLLDNLELELLKQGNKVRFILGVANGDIIVSHQKRADLFHELRHKGFTPHPKKSKTQSRMLLLGQLIIQKLLKSMEGCLAMEYGLLIMSTTYLSMAIGTLTLEKVQELCVDRDRLKK